MSRPVRAEFPSQIPQSVADHLGVLESDIEKAIAAKKAAIEIAKDQFSPFKVGEICEVNGFSHRGKKMRIHSVFLSTERFQRARFEFTATGVVIKADGTDGVAHCESTSCAEIIP